MDCDNKPWHVPYSGQTTLDMFTKPNFDPRPQWNIILEKT